MIEFERRVLSFVGAHRFVQTGHLEAHLGSAAAESIRLRALADQRLLRQLWVIPRDEPLFQITRKGLEAIGSRLEPPAFDVGRVRSELAAVMTWVAAWQGVFGDPGRVLSAREAAWLDQRARASGGAVSGFGYRLDELLRYPSVAMTMRSGRRVAVEMLLWPGSVVEPEALLRAYENQVTFHALLVLMEGGGEDDQLRSETLMRLARSVGIGDRVVVRRVQSGAMISA